MSRCGKGLVFSTHSCVQQEPENDNAAATARKESYLHIGRERSGQDLPLAAAGMRSVLRGSGRTGIESTETRTFLEHQQRTDTVVLMFY